MVSKQKIFEFIKTQELGVISTNTGVGGSPESAVVAFSETDDLELIFGTFNDTRKYKNLKNNPNVSFVIGWDAVTVQYEGVAKETEGKEMERLREIHLKKNPRSKKYAFHENQRFFIVKPKWVRYSDFSTDPETIFEI